MTNQMSSYFTAEKQESLIFMAIGLVAIGIGIWLWMNGHRLKSMAYPLVAVALLKAEETTRMQTVMKNFSIYKAVEMLLLIVGVGIRQRLESGGQLFPATPAPIFQIQLERERQPDTRPAAESSSLNHCDF
jgi:hypothetical protein